MTRYYTEAVLLILINSVVSFFGVNTICKPPSACGQSPIEPWQCLEILSILENFVNPVKILIPTANAMTMAVANAHADP